MGRRGPKKQPAEVKLARGTFRPCRDGDPDKQPTPPADRTPACPNWLGKHGQAKWREMVAKLAPLGLLTSVDGDALACYCDAFDELHVAIETIQREGPICVSEKGGVYQHPAVGMKHKAIERIRRLGALFGLSPSDRQGLQVDKPTRKVASRDRS